MTPRAQAYLAAAESTVVLLAEPAVGQAWDRPSALADMTVGALAAHLARQVIRGPEVLATAGPPGQPVAVLEHYARSAWVAADLDDEANISIRHTAEQNAAGGGEAVLTATRTALAELRRLLPAAPGGLVVFPPWLDWPLLLDDFVLSRLLEIAVHCDDLAVSADLPTPQLPATVLEPVLDLLTRLSVQRHGPTAVLRALSRTERAPATVSAF